MRRLSGPKSLTYPEVGATARDALPPGYRHIEASRTLGHGEDAFHRACSGLLGWDMHRRSGIAIPRGTPVAREGLDVALSLGLGPLRVQAPCRVVSVIDRPTSRGFAYGTLPGHPESGEERFVVELADDAGRSSDNSVVLHIRAFSRPAGTLARLAGPAGRAVQDRITERYLRALAASDVAGGGATSAH